MKITQGEHILVWGVDSEGNEISRPYTPVSRVDETGMLILIIKIYYPSPPRFPKGGKMSMFLDSKKQGEDLEISGPKGKCMYKGKGRFYMKYLEKTLNARSLTFICGGSGITPFYQILQHLNDNQEKKELRMKVKVLYANKTSGDILLRKELDALAACGVIDDLAYCLDRADSPDWKGLVGYVERPMLEKFLWPNEKDHVVFMCGPPMMTRGIEKALEELGYPNSVVY